MPVAAVAKPRNPVVILKRVSPPLAILAMQTPMSLCQITCKVWRMCRVAMSVSAAGH